MYPADIPQDHTETISVCHQYDADSDIICYKHAPYEVTVKTKQLTAVVPLCSQHKAAHDRTGAELRTARKQQ